MTKLEMVKNSLMCFSIDQLKEISECCLDLIESLKIENVSTGIEAKESVQLNREE